MKTTLVILTTSLLAIGLANAEVEEKERDGQKGSADRGSGMSQIDKNNDGKVTGQELMAARQGGKGGDAGKGRPGEPGKGKGKGEPVEFLKRMDKNSDGALTSD